MTPFLLDLLCDPVTGEPLTLVDARRDDRGHIQEGLLKSPSGSVFPIRNGIPRFVPQSTVAESVEAFGEQWNFFNYDDFKRHWLVHTVQNTFGSTEAFRDKVVVDAGGGAGMQTRWMLESGAKHVILLELSASVDDVILRNLGSSGFDNYDVVQCSIDAPPLKPGSIEGIVICHNVIQHTPSVEATAHALFRLLAPGSEFVFNVYARNDKGVLRWLRFHWNRGLRGVLRRQSFAVRLTYARSMGVLRLVPVLGFLLEKSNLCRRGEVPRGEESALGHVRRLYRATVLNTFDEFGSHAYQHYLADSELMALVGELQPDDAQVRNVDRYFARPRPIGAALRVMR